MAVSEEILDLRRRAHASVGWLYTEPVKAGRRRIGVQERRISEEEYAMLDVKKKKNCKWRADPVLVGQLCAAERAYAMSLLEKETNAHGQGVSSRS